MLRRFRRLQMSHANPILTLLLVVSPPFKLFLTLTFLSVCSLGLLFNLYYNCIKLSNNTRILLPCYPLFLSDLTAALIQSRSSRLTLRVSLDSFAAFSQLRLSRVLFLNASSAISFVEEGILPPFLPLPGREFAPEVLDPAPTAPRVEAIPGPFSSAVITR
jgi:hypothetical protein